jgi:hypothetical protein
MTDKETDVLNKTDVAIQNDTKEKATGFFDNIGIPSAPSFINDATKNVGELVTKSTETISDKTVAASESISDSVNVVKNTFDKYFDNSSTILFWIALLLFLAVFIGLVLYYLLSENVLNQQNVIIDGTDKPILCNELTEFKILKNLDNSNGKKRTIAFWIYIDDINKYAGDNYRHIFHIGLKDKDIKNSSPYFILDKNSNKMFLRFSPVEDKLDGTAFDTLNNTKDINNLLYDGDTITGVEIEYIPIQRWVHVAVSINDSYDGSITIFIDGELSKVVDTEYVNKNKNFSGKKLNISKLNLTSNGSLWTGGNINDSAKGLTGFSGLISKVSIYNYDLNKNDVYKEYSNGPFNGLLSRLGLDGYGLRNPIYKLKAYN